MRGKYVEPASARHRVLVVDGMEQLRIPHHRRWFTMLLLPLLLAGWTGFGIMAMHQFVPHDAFLFARTHEALFAFLAFDLCVWLLGWVFFAWLLIAQFGDETLRVQNGDLEVSYGLGPLSRHRRYRGMNIRNLCSAMPLVLEFGMTGAVRFDYGSQTLYLAHGVGEPEGRIIADWLARRLPRTATAID